MTTLEDNLFQTLAFVCTETKQSFFQHIGMSQARTQLLTAVAQASDISHAALQQHLALDGATVTRLVKEFEAEGVLTRRLDPQDNRYTLVSLTPSGQQMVDGLKQAHSDFQTQLLNGVSTEDQEVMLRVLEQLRANLRTLKSDNQTGDL